MVSVTTVFARSDTTATIDFTAQSCAAAIRERRLLLIRRQTTTLGTSEVDIHVDDEHEVDENGLVLEDHLASSRMPLLSACSLLLLLYDAAHEAVHVYPRTIQILAVAIIRERLLFIFVHLEVQLLFESGD